MEEKHAINTSKKHRQQGKIGSHSFHTKEDKSFKKAKIKGGDFCRPAVN